MVRVGLGDVLVVRRVRCEEGAVPVRWYCNLVEAAVLLMASRTALALKRSHCSFCCAVCILEATLCL